MQRTGSLCLFPETRSILSNKKNDGVSRSQVYTIVLGRGEKIKKKKPNKLLLTWKLRATVESHKEENEK